MPRRWGPGPEGVALAQTPPPSGSLWTQKHKRPFCYKVLNLPATGWRLETPKQMVGSLRAGHLLYSSAQIVWAVHATD